MAEVVIALLSPIATYIGKKIVEKIKKKDDQKEIKIDVNSPDYNGTANHWVTNLFERINEQKDNDLQYAYIGDNLGTSIEKDKDVSTLKMHISKVDQDAMNELISNNQWAAQNDPIHGNAVFNFAIPQVAYAQTADDTHQIKYKDFSSIPLNGKYMFTTKLRAPDYGKQDPGDFYKKGGTFEIPVYLEQPATEYEVYPVTPPAPKIPDYAIQTKIIKDQSQSLKPSDEVFVFCPFCGTRIPRSANLKFCSVCGKDIEKHLNF
ncbi:MAG: zinc ribbon domain-containing protein [Promethearchaeota archaeon]